MAIANMVAQQSNAEDISEIAAEVIANASKPEGVLNAVQKQTAYKINLGVNRGKSV